MPNLDLNLVRHALSVARENGFSEVELKLGEDSFTARLEANPRPKAAAPAAMSAKPVADSPETNGVIDVKSSLVGYFRFGKNPLVLGDTIAKGEVIGAITALGISSDIEAPEAGELTEVLVEANQPVEYGQVLARIKK